MFKTNQPKGNTMNKIRIFHKAFENEVSHVATMRMPTNKNLDQTLEYVFKRTQNLDEAWINDSIGFDMIPTVETRSTCVGDIFEVFENEKTVRSRYYVVMGKGFKYITPATFELIAELKDNDLMQYFSNCHLSKNINSQTIKQINVA